MKRSLHYVLTLGLLALLGSACAGDAGDEGAGADYADEMAAQHAHETPEATAIAMEPVIPVDAQPVVYGQLGERALSGYHAVPAQPDSVAEAVGLSGAEALPAVLLIHEWWGLNDNIRTMARRLAGEGFRVLAVDLFHGDVAENPEQARGLVQMALQNQEEMMDNMRLAYQYLRREHQPEAVAVMGWCFGGRTALNTALNMPTELDAAVIYYGSVGDASRDQLQQLGMPVLGIFGGQDESIPISDVRTFESTLVELGKDVEVHVYDDAGHAFANPSGQNYVAHAAEDAWNKTLSFLKEHLYPAQAGSVGL